MYQASWGVWSSVLAGLEKYEYSSPALEHF
jgi:hypothetical protein